MSSLVFGLVIGVSSSSGSDALMAYALFGFGFISTLVALVGLIGVRRASLEFLRVYAISLFIFIATELCVFILLYANVTLIDNYYCIPSIIGVAVSIVLQMTAGVLVTCYQSIVRHLIQQDSPDYIVPNYHSIYA